MAKKETAEKCSECGGARRGRGYAHEPSCSLAKASGAGGKKRKGLSLETMTVSELIAANEKIKDLLKAKVAELDEQKKVIAAILKG